ncbi:hypothetical protein NXW09_28430 [Bacteroides ovatus]|nr:hypothetical protein [Bacteroides ovatus]
MRKIIISFCILLSALSLQAQSVSGIRIDGGNPLFLFTLVETRCACRLPLAL